MRRHPAFDGSAIDVAIEHRHEDRHAWRRQGAEAELGRRRGGAAEADDAVGGGDDEVGAQRRHPRRIAKEIGAPQRRDERDPEQRRPKPAQDQRRRDAGRDEDVAFGMDGRELTTNGIEDRHGERLEQGSLLAPNAAKVTAKRYGSSAASASCSAESARRSELSAPRRPRADGSTVRRRARRAPADPRAGRVRR